MQLSAEIVRMELVPKSTKGKVVATGDTAADIHRVEETFNEYVRPDE